MTGRTSIIVVTWNHREYLGACVGALERALPEPAGPAGPALVRLILVDNASTDGTAAFVRDQLLDPEGNRTRGGLPALFFANHENLGFAGGNNLALRRALDDGDEFAFLLNPDTEVEAGFLERALVAVRADNRIAQVQSLLLRLPGGDRVNSWGNALHFLGFGYAAGDGTPVAAPEATERVAGPPREVAYASGAAVLIRMAALQEIGLLDEELFAYHEDLELSWRARLASWRVLVAPDSRVGHRYQFSREASKLYLLERNRFLVLAWCYRGRTLALLAPALVLMEAGLWLFAARTGWWRQKARAYRYFLAGGRWKTIRESRHRVQRLRRIDDRSVSSLFVAEVVFPEVSPWLLTRVANPLLAWYWRAARALMGW